MLNAEIAEGQIEKATRWWTAAMPAWPRWCEALRGELASRKDRLLKRVLLGKAMPTPLIPKMRSCGTYPHLRGRLQQELLESAGDGIIAIEVYACISVMYAS